jgi:hypothetical protein
MISDFGTARMALANRLKRLYSDSVDSGSGGNIFLRRMSLLSVDRNAGGVNGRWKTGVACVKYVNTLFDTSGRIIYSELSNGTVAAYDPNTSTNFNLATGLNGPIDVALEPSTTSFLVSDSNSNQLSRASLSGGVLNTFSLNGRPDGIAYDGSGNLFVNVSSAFTADNSRVERLDPVTGALITQTLDTGVFLDGLTFDSATGMFVRVRQQRTDCRDHSDDLGVLSPDSAGGDAFEPRRRHLGRQERSLYRRQGE